ncbi:hypothetical protein EAG_15247 [Camponotus floridanus]|uniref:Uncharacterized protein n=1 Tax=Camponotus floridanus TaxID=104421 RepID=E2A089_CAMFO|nr:hypothetical protein EAG_15247 [Camponotus floridanus]
MERSHRPRRGKTKKQREKKTDGEKEGGWKGGRWAWSGQDRRTNGGHRTEMASGSAFQYSQQVTLCKLRNAREFVLVGRRIPDKETLRDRCAVTERILARSEQIMHSAVRSDEIETIGSSDSLEIAIVAELIVGPVKLSGREETTSRSSDDERHYAKLADARPAREAIARNKAPRFVADAVANGYAVTGPHSTEPRMRDATHSIVFYILPGRFSSRSVFLARSQPPAAPYAETRENEIRQSRHHRIDRYPVSREFAIPRENAQS